MDTPSWLEKIRGYIELGMLDEAWQAIDALSSERRGSPEAQECRIIIMLDRGEHDAALDLSKNLCDLHPDNHAGFIQGAYSLHARGDTEEAIEHLQSGPESLRDEPIYYYNLACYELVLGKQQAAMTWLEESFKMDPPSRAKALEDPDLASIRNLIIERNF